MPGDLPDALVYTAESAARMAFGTRFKKLPSAIFAKLSLPVLMVLAVFSFIYVTVVFAVAIPWLEHSVPGVLNVGFLTVTSGLGLTMYLCCVYCEPGRVPADWRPDNEAGRSMLELKRKGGARYCNKCLRHKPPRTHHCRVCNRCVLRMDHHCVWVNNCVGHRNYKSFFLFLFYITCACVHALAILSAHTIHTVGEDSHRSQRAKMIRAKLAGAAGGAGAVMGGSSSVGGGGGGGGAGSSIRDKMRFVCEVKGFEYSIFWKFIPARKVYEYNESVLVVTDRYIGVDDYSVDGGGAGTNDGDAYLSSPQLSPGGSAHSGGSGGGNGAKGGGGGKDGLNLFIKTAFSMFTSWIMGFGMPGRVGYTGNYEWHEEVTSLPAWSYQRLRQAKNAGLRTVIAVPVDGGVMEFGSRNLNPHNMLTVQYIQKICGGSTTSPATSHQ
mmetsp:Transcript_35749/g.87991  ORF Transcript_35749/g.87991 Transcript_35749/m.87991 type:complete len:438 (-) Transcript_35749:78-1391(-)